MKKSKVLMIALVACLVVLGVGAVLIFSNNIGLTYANADQYTAGETTVTGTVENLDVNWLSGNVRVEYHTGEGIRVAETGNKTIAGDDQLRWWLDGTTLRIQYAKSGRIRLLDNLEKTLTVSLPEGTVLKTAKIHTTSGDLDIPKLTADETELTVTSGNVNAAADTRKMTVSATSGDLNVRLEGETDTVSIGVTSGSISAELGTVKKLTIKSTSGNIRVSGRADDAEISATSGTVNVWFGVFRNLKISVTSGDVTAALPENPGFSCTAEVTSGNIDFGFAMAKEGNTYYCGDRSGNCTIKTTSGNIRINKAD